MSLSKYIILIVAISCLFATEIKTSCEAYLLAQFPKDTEFNMHIIKLTADIKKKIQQHVKQKFHRDELYYWNITQGDSSIAYAFLDNVLGKTMPITFIVILNINGDIISTNVIKYREAYGAEVGNKRWLIQFQNKNNKSSYEIGKDIDGISGATISVKSMSKGIHKIVTLFPLIRNQLQ